MRMPPTRIAVALAIVLLVAQPGAAASSEDMTTCKGGQLGEHVADDAIVAACGRAIDSGSLHGAELAAMYKWRGVAYARQNNLDRAIADYDAALRLDPKTENGYVYRASADLKKGDADRAVADYGQAIRVDPVNGPYYERGRVYLDYKGDPDHAIADLSEAIKRSDDSSRHLTLILSHFDRGRAYLAKGAPDRAIADFGEVIREPNAAARGYPNRALAYRMKGDNERALADYAEAIRLDPNSAGTYAARGRFLLYNGSLAQAEADFKKAAELAPKDAITVLWLEVARRRAHTPSTLAQAAQQLDMTAWPAPVVRLFLGEATPVAVLAAATDPNPLTKKGRLCTANFYGGELALSQGEKSEAERLFRLAVSECPVTASLIVDATAELKALRGGR
ncbi:MAG TPA: tetratricopeptide repeat protein [Stellaceae bacterium]|nr:tetratricopeptide repeat protein [Stellaceae bacterium]